MEFNPRDQKILLDLRRARAAYPDLKELLEFYEKLFSSQFAFKLRLLAAGTGERLAGKEILFENLDEGRTQVAFEELEMQPVLFLGFYGEISRLLTSYIDPAEGLATGQKPVERILEWAREIFSGRGPLAAVGPSDDLARAATGFVLAPYLQLACDLLLPKVPMNLWHRAFCPVCGGWPAFSALLSDSSPRMFLCARCHAEWTYGRVGCPFCKSKEAQTYYAGEEGRHRLYVCEACNRYLKAVDFRKQGMDLCLPVECLVTVSMDLAAREKGFTP